MSETPAIKTKNCGNCKHANTAGLKLESLTGYCRRYPPATINRPGEQPTSQFPIVHLANFYCGEFVAKLDS